jgi:hypothetical protein
LTLLEFVVREALKKVDKPLTGLYPGNPKRTTTRPSAEILLRTFRDINRVFQLGLSLYKELKALNSMS